MADFRTPFSCIFFLYNVTLVPRSKGGGCFPSPGQAVENREAQQDAFFVNARTVLRFFFGQ